MKFLLDVCASSRSLQRLLIDLQHDVRLAADFDPRADDENLLDLALRESRIVVTEDKDFGELVFVQRRPHRAIVRFVEMRVDEQVAAMRELLERYQTELESGALIVVSRGRIRIRA
ncbi:MAG: toxin-antitoxin system, toxin component, PIN family protein [Nitrospira sp.]|nr:toxin-antitoxin system, toxin component, PIN family protein [Nitrospira sp.]